MDTPESPSIPSRLGSIVGGHYALVRRLGAGGSAVVYEAENTWTHRRVALKLLNAGGDTEAARRFLQEARVATRLRHPNIVDVLDMGQDESDGALFIVQELIDGEDFAALLASRGALPLAEALEIIVPVLGALGAAHAQGVIHRDIKPANLLIVKGASGLVPKLIDFGVSKVRDAGVARTRTGTLLGTPIYMSPEQMRAEPDLDARADVWSVGVMLYEALSGARPFDAESHHGVMFKVLSSDAARLDAVAPTVPGDVADVVQRALQRDRDARFPDVRAMLDALLRCPSVRASEQGRSLAQRHADSLTSAPPDAARHEAIVAPVVATRGVTLDASLPSTPEPVVKPSSTRPPRRPAGVSIAVVSIAVASLAAGLWVVTSRRADAPRAAVATVGDPSMVLQIRSVIQSQMPHLSGCYERAMTERPALMHQSLRGVLHLVVGADSRARAVRVTGLDEAPGMSACVEQQFAGLQYPHNDGGADTNITYPLVFRGP